MSDYTPTTDEIRAAYFVRKTGLHVSAMSHYPEFDRWLSELIRKEREEAWEEGFDRGFYRGQVLPGDRDACEAGVENPYRKDQP